MDISTPEPMNDEMQEKLKEMFGEPFAQDERTALMDKLIDIDRKQMTDLANIAKQPISVGIQGVGEIKTLSDGTRYQVTDRGWKKLETADYPY